MPFPIFDSIMTLPETDKRRRRRRDPAINFKMARARLSSKHKISKLAVEYLNQVAREITIDLMRQQEVTHKALEHDPNATFYTPDVLLTALTDPSTSYLRRRVIAPSVMHPSFMTRATVDLMKKKQKKSKRPVKAQEEEQ